MFVPPSIRLSTPPVRGEALGVYTALTALAGGVGSVLGGWVAGFGYALAFGAAGGLVLVAAVAVAALRQLSSLTPDAVEGAARAGRIDASSAAESQRPE